MKDALKVTGKGILVMFGSFLLAKLLMAFGLLIIACFTAVTLGCVGVVFFYDWRGSSASLLTGIFATIFCGIIPAIKTDYRGFGTAVKNIPVDRVINYSNTSIFTFTNAHVVDSLYGYEPIMGRRSKVGNLYCAPLVADNWKPGMEIHAWVLSDLREDESWKKPYNAAVHRLKTEDAESAIADAVKGYGLTTSKDAAVLYWCKNPYGEFFSEFEGGLFLTLVCVLTWTTVSLASFKTNQPAKEPKKTGEPSDEEIEKIIAERQQNSKKENSEEENDAGALRTGKKQYRKKRGH